MDPTEVVIPASRTGYRADDLERFFAAADHRIAELTAAITAASAGRDAPAAPAPAPGLEQGPLLADIWLAAQRDADAIRGAAIADAQVLLARAEDARNRLRGTTPRAEPT